MKRTVVLLWLLVLVGVTSFGAVKLRFSDWHLTEDVWNQSLREAICVFETRYPAPTLTR